MLIWVKNYLYSLIISPIFLKKSSLLYFDNSSLGKGLNAWRHILAFILVLDLYAFSKKCK